VFAHWLLIGHGAFYPIEYGDFYCFVSYFWHLKTFIITFLKKKFEFRFLHLGNISPEKRKG
jgi:hypothetical protein